MPPVEEDENRSTLSVQVDPRRISIGSAATIAVSDRPLSVSSLGGSTAAILPLDEVPEEEAPLGAGPTFRSGEVYIEVPSLASPERRLLRITQPTTVSEVNGTWSAVLPGSLDVNNEAFELRCWRSQCYPVSLIRDAANESRVDGDERVLWAEQEVPLDPSWYSQERNNRLRANIEELVRTAAEDCRKWYLRRLEFSGETEPNDGETRPDEGETRPEPATWEYQLMPRWVQPEPEVDVTDGSHTVTVLAEDLEEQNGNWTIPASLDLETYELIAVMVEHSIGEIGGMSIAGSSEAP